MLPRSISLQLRVSVMESAGALMFLPMRARTVATRSLYLRRYSCDGLACSAADSCAFCRDGGLEGGAEIGGVDVKKLGVQREAGADSAAFHGLRYGGTGAAHACRCCKTGCCLNQMASGNIRQRQSLLFAGLCLESVSGAKRKDIAARLIWKAMVRYSPRFDNARARTSHLYDISAGPVPQAVTQLHTQRRRRRMTAMRAGECEACGGK